MKRGGPLRRKTGLKRTALAPVIPIGEARSKRDHPGGSGLKRSPLAARSPKMAKLYRETRAPAVALAVAEDRSCEVSPVLMTEGCRERPSRGHSGWGYHERRKRSAGGSLLNPANLMWACAFCNDAIELEPALVRRLTGDALVVREGDPEWDELGKRADL